MTNEQTIEKLYDLKLGAMAEALRDMLSRPEQGQLTFAERLGLLVDHEWLRREENRLTRRLKAARLKTPATVVRIPAELTTGIGAD